jgi:O-antigen ligase
VDGDRNQTDSLGANNYADKRGAAVIAASSARRSGPGAGSARSSAFVLTAGTARVDDVERFALAMVALAVAMLPLLVPGGPGNVAPADAFIVIAVAASLFWAGHVGHRWRFPFAAPIAVIVVAGALASLAGRTPASGAVALLQDLLLLLWCWAIVNVASSAERLRFLLATWAYSATAWALVLLAGLAAGSSTVTGQTLEQGSRTTLTFGDPNISANYYVVSIMIIWAAAVPRRLGARFAATALLLAALVTTGSNSALVSLTVGTVLAAVVAVYRRRGIAAATAACALAVLGGYTAAVTIDVRAIEEAATTSRYAFIRDGIGRGEESVAQRGALLAESVELYQAEAPVGIGPAATKQRLEDEMAPYPKEAHNDYVAALVERGALGLLGLALLVASIALRSLSLPRRVARSSAVAVVNPGPLIGAVAGTLVAGVAYEVLHFRHAWALFGIVAALSLWGREQRAWHQP